MRAAEATGAADVRGGLCADGSHARDAAPARRCAAEDHPGRKRKTARALRPVAERVGLGRFVAPEEVFDAFERLYADVEAVRQILLDESRTSARLVLNPARVVVDETRRSFAYLCLYGVATDAVIVNRLLPPEAGRGYFARWAEREREELADIERSFPVPILRAPLHPQELRAPAARARRRSTAIATRPTRGVARCGSRSAAAAPCCRSTCRRCARRRSTSGCAATSSGSASATSSAALRCRPRWRVSRWPRPSSPRGCWKSPSRPHRRTRERGRRPGVRAAHQLRGAELTEAPSRWSSGERGGRHRLVVHPADGGARPTSAAPTKNPALERIRAVRSGDANHEENTRRRERMQRAGLDVGDERAACDAVALLIEAGGPRASVAARTLAGRSDPGWRWRRPRSAAPRADASSVPSEAPGMSVGHDTYAHDLFACGGANVFATAASVATRSWRRRRSWLRRPR